MPAGEAALDAVVIKRKPLVAHAEQMQCGGRGSRLDELATAGG